MNYGRTIGALCAIGLAALIAYPLYAHCGNCAADAKAIAAQLDQNKVTMTKVIAAAEQRSNGRAISVISKMTDPDHKVVVEVYCVTGTTPDAAKIQMCKVDGGSGAVLEMKEVKQFPVTKDDGSVAPGPGSSSGAAKPGQTPGGGPGSTPGAMTIANRTVEAACGVCIYKMAGAEGCPLAVKIDGKAYLVQGAQWPNHDYCDRNCKAIVSGRIEGDKFIATSLKPLE